MIVGTTALGDLLGLSQRHIYNLEKLGILIKEDKDSWNANLNIQNYINYKIEATSSSTDRGKVMIRKELAEAKLKELQYKEKCGALISLEAVAKELEDIAITVSNKLYSLPMILKRKYKITQKINLAMQKEIEEILKELKDPNIYIKKSEEVAELLSKEKEKDKYLDEALDEVESE